MKRTILMAALAFSGAVTAQEPPADELPPVEVTGERSPFDSDRPRLERKLPCIGTCDEEPAPADGIVRSVLGFLILPAEPPDNRATTPISLQQPRDRLQVKQP